MTCYLIIPCYNEELRLKTSEFLSYQDLKEIKFIFANDGSTDNTTKAVNNIIKHSPTSYFFYDAPINQGKAEVIRQAFLHFDKQEIFTSQDWIGYWDADLATPIWEVKNMINYAHNYDYQVNSIWGSRLLRLGADIKRSPHRHYLGRIFATIIGTFLKIKSYDSQCGAKLFDYQSAQVAFRDKFISRWVFDVEILLRLKDSHIIEYPLKKWEDVPGSKVKIFKEIFRVMIDVYKIKKRYQTK